MRGTKPGHAPAGGAGVFSAASTTVVPLGGEPALTVYCTPPGAVPAAVHDAPVHVVLAIGVAPHGNTSIESAAGGVTVAVPPVTASESVLTSSLVAANTSLPLRVARKTSVAVCAPARVPVQVRLVPPGAVVTVPALLLTSVPENARPECLGDREAGRGGDCGAEIADELRAVDRPRRSGLVGRGVGCPDLEIGLAHVAAGSDADRDDA